MKGLSIKSKIMLFYTVCTTLIVAIMLLVMVHISGRVVDRDIRDNLVLMVEEDVDDLDFDIIDEDDIGDAYEEGAVVFYTEEGLVGSLSVDDSYITSKNGVRILVYGPHDRLLLGNVYDYDIDKSKYLLLQMLYSYLSIFYGRLSLDVLFSSFISFPPFL